MRNNTEKAAVNTQPSNRLVQFDGLRGIAIIIVVLSHCYIMNQGGVANAIFFALSGFLLINPFKDAYEQRFLSIWSILKFYKSRALRILPAYYFVLLILFLQTGFNVIEKDVFLKLLYIGDIHEHLWFVFAYFWLMYIIPFIFFFFLLLAKKIKFLRNDLVCACIFISLSALIRFFYLGSDMFDIRLDQLMLGIASGYIFRFIRTDEKKASSFRKHPVLGQLLILFIFLLVIVTSSDVLKLFNPSLAEYYIGWNLIFVVGFFMSLLVLLVALYPDGFIGKFLQSKALVFIGKHAFTVYLLNNFVIAQLNIQSKYFLFICVFSVSLVLAWVIDSVIDKVKSIIVNAFSRTKKIKGDV